jgi:hypothetical protein
MFRPLGITLAASLSLPAAAQKDVAVVDLAGVQQMGRTGVYPNGLTAIASISAICNQGSEDIPWLAAMNEDHPMMAFLMARERGGRFEQISDRSYVKHAVNAFNTPGCGACPVFGSQPVLAVGCVDTYQASINANNYHLGPPDEIDPFLATWTAACSHFDRGEPPEPPPLDCDGIRSLTQAQATAMGPIGHRLQVPDAELDDDTASYYWQVHNLVRGEAESLRGDNLGWRGVDPTWGGTNWTFPTTTFVQTGSVLNAWSGATVSSAVNGAVDGRVFVAGRVTSVACGTHFEYAVHNRDNAGGIHVFRVPLASGAVVVNAGMKDVDGDPLNDWTVALGPTEVAFIAPAGPLAWNTIYNFWFDTDASAQAGSASLEQASGSGTLSVAGLPVPSGALAVAATAYCTAGTAASGCRAVLSASGFPSAGAPSGFVVRATAVEGNKDGLFFFGTGGRIANSWGNGTSYRCTPAPVSRGPLTPGTGTNGACDGTAALDLNARWTAKPNQNPGAGATVQTQFWYRDPQSTSNQPTSLSDALEFPVCP